MTDRLRTVAIAISVVGIAIAGYLTYVHYAGISPVCEIAHGCEKVQTSEWSKVAGIPVAVLGLLGYVGILAALLIPGETAATAAAGMALIGLGFSAYLTYREVFTIEAICIWCVASALLMAALAVVTVLRLARQAPPAPVERRARRPVAAHAVDAAARRRRRGAEVDARNRRRVRHAPGDRTREQLAEVLRPAVDVAADVVRVAPLHLGAVHRRAGRDQPREPGREALDLGLDRRGHVAGRAVRHVAVGPRRLAAVRHAGAVEAAGLHEQDERPRRVVAARDRLLGGADLLERPAEVDRRRPARPRAPSTGSGRRAPSRA